MVVRICFVCLGNICRSPTAEGVMKTLVNGAGLADRILVESAGTGSWHIGEEADERTREVAQARGYALTGRARQFQASDFARCDYVLAMDRSNLRDLERMAPSPSARAKIHLFRSLDPDGGGHVDVPDPYYGGPRGFEDVLDMCERTCRAWLHRVAREHHFDVVDVGP